MTQLVHVNFVVLKYFSLLRVYKKISSRGLHKLPSIPHYVRMMTSWHKYWEFHIIRIIPSKVRPSKRLSEYWNFPKVYRITSNNIPAIINFEVNFGRKYYDNFWEYKYFGESNCSSRSVIEMKHHFDIERYPREWEKKFIHFFGRRLSG